MVQRWAAIPLCLAAAAGAFAAAVESEPVTPVLPPGQLDTAKVEIGRKLFHDRVLSRSGTTSCASCHPLDAGGADGAVHASGADGRPLDFNTPTIFNVANNFRLNWRGEFTTLEEQNEQALLNRRIMNMAWTELLARLGANAGYRGDFAALYGGALAPAQVLDALAAFQRSLATPNARFDRWLRGARDALTPQEEHGYQLFKSYGCIACHQGMNIGGNLFQRFGVFHQPFTHADVATPDLGRFTLTGAPEDRHVFRVPSLRNVAVTAPYFHNGRTSSLREAVMIMARSQLGRDLPDGDATAIVQFLATLTGEYQGRALAQPAGALGGARP
jgi:cytochrome c peroxidase